jgi:hypothetical protein
MNGFLRPEKRKRRQPLEILELILPVLTYVKSNETYFPRAANEHERKFAACVALRTRLLIVLAAAIVLIVVCGPANAHHGASMFDMEHLITVKGTVTNFDWSNPHAMIYADVKDEKGDLQKWAIETRGGPAVLTRAGWTKDTIKSGDQVTLVGHPAKNGTNNMRLAKVVLANGQELNPEPHSWF